MKKSMRLIIILSSFWGFFFTGYSQNPVYSLKLNSQKYTLLTITVNGQSIPIRAYENCVYVQNPIDITHQIMNIYIPEAYFQGENVGKYSAHTAPIFLPNGVGGYMPSLPLVIPNKTTITVTNSTSNSSVQAGQTAKDGGLSASCYALSQGYIVAFPGTRGTLSKNNIEYTGKAPAPIVDLKAAVRYLRYNQSVIPGNMNEIIANGTSAGGALSVLLATSGDNPDYLPYLKALGAAMTSDKIYASSAFCPITNLNHADSAYEWQFGGIDHYSAVSFSQVNGKLVITPTQGSLTEKQISLSSQLKSMFPNYLNSLHLLSPNNTPLTLESNGDGSFKNYLISKIIESAQQALNNGVNLSSYAWLTISNGQVTSLNFEEYNAYVTRMKTPPAFDSLDLSSAETMLFGTTSKNAQHFTQFSQNNTQVSGSSIASEQCIKMMNPMDYMNNKDGAKYYRIRYGSIDNNTSSAIELILATKLANTGHQVDFEIPWGVAHAGDYDLVSLFNWMNTICALKN